MINEMKSCIHLQLVEMYSLSCQFHVLGCLELTVLWLSYMNFTGVSAHAGDLSLSFPTLELLSVRLEYFLVFHTRFCYFGLEIRRYSGRGVYYESLSRIVRT